MTNRSICFDKRQKETILTALRSYVLHTHDWTKTPLSRNEFDDLVADIQGLECEAPEAPRYLPIGTVVKGGMFADQFAAVLEFAEKHQNLSTHLSQAVFDAREHWERHFDHDSDDSIEAYNDLCDALQSACPPFCFFGSIVGCEDDIGVWPNDDEIEEAIYKNGTGRMCRVGLDLEISVASEAFNWVIVINDDGSYRELYECKKGVKSLVWKLP